MTPPVRPLTHGLSQYTYSRCRCGVCREAHRRYQREYRRRRRENGGPLEGGPVRHGLTGYSLDRCRCEVCRTARNDYMRELRMRRV